MTFSAVDSSFVARSTGAAISGGATQRVAVSPKRPLSIITEGPVRSRKQAWEVIFQKKNAHTALGYTARPDIDTYLTPVYTEHTQYVSMGGAGITYPDKESSPGSYVQGDTVRVELELDEEGGSTGVVKFFVNNRHACSRPWKHGPAYPAISCNVGELAVDVKWVVDSGLSSTS